MLTATHRHFRLTLADACGCRPIRWMPIDEFNAYRNNMLRYWGFDHSKPIQIVRGMIDIIYSQPK